MGPGLSSTSGSIVAVRVCRFRRWSSSRRAKCLRRHRSSTFTTWEVLSSRNPRASAPGRGVAWEHSVYRAFAGPVLEDQVEALQAAAERFGFLNLERVGILGWSFGGYLAAMAVLR